MRGENNADISAPMELSKGIRKPGGSLVPRNFSTGFQLGLRNFTRPHLSYRLGLLWIFLDPLLKAIVYSFLMIVIRGNTSPESLVIGVFTIHALNNTFSSSMNIRLSEEPFPLSHTPTLPLVVSKISSDLLNAIFLGLSSSLILVLVIDLPPKMLIVLPAACMMLSIIGSGTGLLLSPIVMLVKDLSKFVSYVLLLSFFLQCVLYPFSMTEGYHRAVLSWLPHTIAVEWCRSVANASEYPFSFDHAALVMLCWSIPMIYGFYKFDQYRWRSTTWS